MTREHLEVVTESAEVPPGALELVRIEGREAISTPYRYELVLESTEDGGLAPEAIDDLVRRPLLVRYGPDGLTEIHGLLTSLRTESIADAARVVYRAELAPRLARLALAVRSRVFQELDVIGIARAVLEEHGLREGSGFELRLAGTYPVSEYTVQYQESDLAFVSRLLEHFGIFYYFRQEPEGERLVIADSNRAFEAFADEPVTYAPDVRETVHDRAVHTLSRCVAVQHASVLLRDYNWRAPAIPLQNQAQADATTGYGLLHLYGEHYKNGSEGDRLAAIRAEETASRRVRYAGTGAMVGLAPGQRIELSGHPCGEYDRDYAITEVELAVGAEGEDGAGFHQRFHAIELETAYRPARVTPRPRIHGFMHGTIDGPQMGTAAPIDEHGRYKVILPFDLNAQAGGRASRWVRMAQPSSGRGYGVHLPIHIGAEVAIAHLDGDPDRPVIMGAVHNAETVNHVTQSNATQSGIRTQAGIRITFDDDCGGSA